MLLFLESEAGLSQRRLRAGALKPKMYKKRCLDQITNSIKNRCRLLRYSSKAVT